MLSPSHIIRSTSIEEVASLTGEGDALAYIYCEYLSPKTLQPSAVVGTLIKQLLLASGISRPMEEKITGCFSYNRYEERCPDYSELAELLRAVATHFSRVFIAIDGLDECEPADQKLIVTSLRALTRMVFPITKLLICSRHEVEIARALGDAPRLRLTAQLNKDDISRYVSTMVNTRIGCGDLFIGGDTIKSEIIQALVGGAEGM